MSVSAGVAGLAVALSACGGAVTAEPAAGSLDRPSLGSSAPDAGTETELLEQIQSLSRSTPWQTTAGATFGFDTFHPQGMMVLGDRIFLSSVEIIERTTKYPSPQDGYDRTPGRGKGHLFVTDLDGNLIRDIEIGAGDRYHPSGFGFDGERIWIASAEYRPDSASTVYTVDPETFEVRPQFDVADHVGGVVWDADRSVVVGVSWGSRTFYDWTRDGRQLASWKNPGDFVDYQGCQYLADSTAACTGVASVRGADGESVPLGGLALVDMAERRVLKETPVQQFSANGQVLTQNPAFVRLVDGRFELLTAPDDGSAPGGTRMYRTVVDGGK